MTASERTGVRPPLNARCTGRDALSAWNRRRSTRARTASSSSRPRPPEGARSCAPPWSQLAQLKPRVLLGDLRRRRLDARAHARARCSRSAQAGHAAAPHISCIGSSRADIARRSSATGERHPAHRRAARRPASGIASGGRAPLRERAGRVHPRAHRRLVPRRGRLLPRVPPAGAEPGRRRRREVMRKVETARTAADSS